MGLWLGRIITLLVILFAGAFGNLLGVFLSGFLLYSWIDIERHDANRVMGEKMRELCVDKD